MDIDASLAVDVLAHDARDDGHAVGMKLMLEQVEKSRVITALFRFLLL